jgi:threonine/homoserine/homoserine lactone efflux protein
MTDLYWAYLLALAVFFATPPGPSQVLMIANSLRFGTRRALPTIAGDLSANALQMTAAAFGLAALLATSGAALTVMKWLGVAYLIYVGVKTFRAAPTDLSRASGDAGHGWRLARQGFLTSGANPKAVIFFAALFPQFIDPAQPIWPQLLLLGGTYLVVDGVLLVAWGLAAASLNRRLRIVGRWLNRVSGGLMIAAAALLAMKDLEARPATR